MKDRLTGAIILVVLIVLLVPELLSGSRKAARTAAPTVTGSSEEPPLRSYTINLADDPHPGSDAAPSNGPAMPQAAADPPLQSAVAAAGDTAPTSAQVQAQEESHPASNAAPAAAAAPPTIAPPAVASPAPVTPKPTSRKPAPRAAQRDPKPARSHGSEVANATASAAESGWMVQLGVFASRENAERLAGEVRDKGFKASVAAVNGSSRKLFRVSVGPAADRAAAQELQSRLRAAGRPGGTVVPSS